MRFAVVTKVPRDALADAVKYRVRGVEEEVVNADELPIPEHDLRPVGLVKVPAFRPGEILVMDDEGYAELSWPYRKPSKWGVEVELFDSPEEAVERSREVVEKFEQEWGDLWRG